ncbi:MAG TPA: LLM class flavin-dependent oxidoreductase [Candidatus Acidoferrales bacterium]|nr:LLM class flavin-dependent oxidoreductase [Candidatus Acidoferrales bacterium]
MHLCGFLIAGPVTHSHAIWRNPAGDVPFLSMNFYREIATTLERGLFDFVFFADRVGISDRYGGNLEIGIRYGDQDATRLDPVPVLGAMSAMTAHIGLGATRSTTYDQPYNVAREFATLDHISAGRAAWNVVTSMNDGEAMNFGEVVHMPHDERYDRADEFLEVAFKLWDSWDPDAMILDRSTGVYADPSRVHYINHAGRWFKSRGPLNIPRGPQGRPVIIQAGSSGRGKAFAARWADVVFTIQQSPKLLQAFCDDVRASVDGSGRKGSDCKILNAVMPFVAPTEAEAREKQRLHNELINPMVGLSTLSSHVNHDFSLHKLDEPIENVQSSGTQGMFAAVMRMTTEQRLTLGDIGKLYARSVLVPQVVGTPSAVAAELARFVDEGGCDGFVITPAFIPETFADFVDYVVPELQSRGLFRTEYTGATLRDHLGLGLPASSFLADSPVST